MIIVTVMTALNDGEKEGDEEEDDSDDDQDSRTPEAVWVIITTTMRIVG